MSADAAPLAGRRAVVVTCSTRAAGGVYPDRGGTLLVEALRGWGCAVPEPTVDRIISGFARRRNDERLRRQERR